MSKKNVKIVYFSPIVSNNSILKYVSKKYVSKKIITYHEL